MISGNAFDAMTRCAGRGPVRREYTTKAITLGKPVDTVTGTQWPASIQLCQVTVDNVRKGIYDYYGAYREHSWIFAGKVNKKLLQWNKYGFRQIGTLVPQDCVFWSRKLTEVWLRCVGTARCYPAPRDDACTWRWESQRREFTKAPVKVSGAVANLV